jgi:hypothetical protein
MRYRLRTLLIVMAILPPLAAAFYLHPLVTMAALIAGGGFALAGEYISWLIDQKPPPKDPN